MVAILSTGDELKMVNVTPSKYINFFSFLNTKIVRVVELLPLTDIFFLHSQYHGYWWLGDGRTQAISSHDIDIMCLGYSSFSTRGVKGQLQLTHLAKWLYVYTDLKVNRFHSYILKLLLEVINSRGFESSYHGTVNLNRRTRGRLSSLVFSARTPYTHTAISHYLYKWYE